jgi:hypothetical protein
MITKKSRITLEIISNMPVDAQISLLGGPYDPAASSVNSNTLFQWDITGQSFSGLILATIQYRKVGVIPYTTLNLPIPTSFIDLVRILNLQNLGVFWSTDPYTSASQIIYTTNDDLQFFQLSLA